MERNEHTRNNTEEKRNYKVTVTLNSVGWLKELNESLPLEHKKTFAEKYGQILELSGILVDVSALNVLARYWNIELRCFEFPNRDLTPTIEEYACILKIHPKEDLCVFTPLVHPLKDEQVIERFAYLLGLPTNQMKLSGHVGSKGLTRSFVKIHLERLKHQKEWGIFARVLALAIYGLIFPSGLDIVDQSAIDVFFMVETKGRNPIPAILVETMLTLSFCQQKPKSKIRCCAQLLYVWIITHMYAGSLLKKLSHPLRHFQRIAPKKLSELEWKVEFNNVGGESFRWICPWFDLRGEETIYNCGKFPNVPLMGPRGCIAYTPSIILKQFGWTQREPRKEQLGGCYFWYQDDNAQSRKIVDNILEATLKKKGNPEAESEMAEQLEVHKAQLQTLTEENEKVCMELEAAHRKNGRISQRLESLKNENADFAQLSRTRKGKEKVSETYSEKIRELEGRTHSLFLENDELKRTSSQEDRVIQELKASIDGQRRKRKKVEKDLIQQCKETSRKKLIVGDLRALLEQTKADRDKARTSSTQFRDLFLEAARYKNFWRTEALEQGKVIEFWKKKHDKIIEELNFHIPHFVQSYKKADSEVRANPMTNFPPRMRDFMHLCGRLARGLKRKKMKLLT
ncbi:hypothetical protein SESBI_14946 [Sesbania bispinosa]|nr:hypothetical protein SESBI_14946 [Sesbania bispinosa]